MDTLEAKQILSTYQSDKEPFSDPYMLEALNRLDQDKELSDWFENQLAFDRQVKESLNEVRPQAGLRESLIKNHRRQKRNNIIRYVRWASALAAILVIGLGGFWKYTTNYNSKIHEYATLREGMAHFIAGSFFTLDFLDKDLGNIANWLKEQDSPMYESIPAALAAKEPIGCKKMNWRGRDVSLVCFHREDGKIIHMFVAERDGFSEEAIADLDKVLVSHDLETGGWMTDTHVYLLTGSEPGVTVSEYLG